MKHTLFSLEIPIYLDIDDGNTTIFFIWLNFVYGGKIKISMLCIRGVKSIKKLWQYDSTMLQWVEFCLWRKNRSKHDAFILYCTRMVKSIKRLWQFESIINNPLILCRHKWNSVLLLFFFHISLLSKQLFEKKKKKIKVKVKEAFVVKNKEPLCV